MKIKQNPQRARKASRGATTPREVIECPGPSAIQVTINTDLSRVKVSWAPRSSVAEKCHKTARQGDSGDSLRFIRRSCAAGTWALGVPREVTAEPSYSQFPLTISD